MAFDGRYLNLLRRDGWIINEGPKALTLVIWLIINTALFWGTFAYYNSSESYYYLRRILGLGLPWARGSAACLNLNCMLILLPVCRNLLTLLRNLVCQRHCKRSIRNLADSNIDFHKYLAWMIALMTAIHTGAHIFNVENFVKARDSTDSLLSKLSLISSQNWLNPVNADKADPVLEVVKLLPGSTGVVLTLMLIAFFATANEHIRRSFFEAFWFSHHLFVLFFIILITHGMGGVVRKQGNTKQHNPLFCQNQTHEWGKIPECPQPIFVTNSPSTWKWLVLPLAIYVIERLIRFLRSFRKLTITEVIEHEAGCIEIQIEPYLTWNSRPGQYVFVKCSEISHFEWHPFTLTSSPVDDKIILHIRKVGDWTNELARLCLDNSLKPKLAVDGPFGTSSEDIFRFKTSVLIGAGIGVTPYASSLKLFSSYYENTQTQSGESGHKLDTVYFFWICKEIGAFSWFGNLLQSLEEAFHSRQQAHQLNYNIYLTRGWDVRTAKMICSHETDSRDILTGLEAKTHYGRPNWEPIFEQIADNHHNEDVGVFVCGPEGLSQELKKLCLTYPRSDNHRERSTRFYFHKENF